MSIEQPRKDVENPERRRYEYKDAEGKKIADVEAEFLASGDMVDDPASGEVVVARRLASLKLTNPEDGRVFDVLAAFNSKNADVIVPEKRIANYSHGVLGTEAIVPAPESPLDLATMLHELGHVDQLEDPETLAFSGFAGISKAFMAEGGLKALGASDAEPQTALWDILDVLVRVMAPILSFTADEIWAYLPATENRPSVFLAGFPTPAPADGALAEKWERLLAVRAAVTKALEEARQAGVIGHSLDAWVQLGAADGLRTLLGQQAADLPALFIVSQVTLHGDLGPETISPLLADLKVRVQRARGGKCERCWNYSEAVGRDPVHPGLCERCLPVVTALGT